MANEKREKVYTFLKNNIVPVAIVLVVSLMASPNVLLPKSNPKYLISYP